MRRATCRTCKGPLPALTGQKGRPLEYCPGCPPLSRDDSIKRAMRIIRAHAEGAETQNLEAAYGVHALKTARALLARLGVTP